MIRSLFEAPSLREAALELGLPHQAPPFLAAEIFDLLFAPSDLLRSELQRLQEEPLDASSEVRNDPEHMAGFIHVVAFRLRKRSGRAPCRASDPLRWGVASNTTRCLKLHGLGS